MDTRKHPKNCPGVNLWWFQKLPKIMIFPSKMISFCRPVLVNISAMCWRISMKLGTMGAWWLIFGLTDFGLGNLDSTFKSISKPVSVLLYFWRMLVFHFRLLRRVLCTIKMIMDGALDNGIHHMPALFAPLCASTANLVKMGSKVGHSWR